MSERTRTTDTDPTPQTERERIVAREAYYCGAVGKRDLAPTREFAWTRYPDPMPDAEPAPSGNRYRLRRDVVERWMVVFPVWRRYPDLPIDDVRHVAALLDAAEREAR